MKNVFLAVLTLVLSACTSNQPTPPVTPIPVTPYIPTPVNPTLVVSPDGKKIAVGEDLSISASRSNSSAKVIWSVQDVSVLQKTDTTLSTTVTGLKPGQSEICASLEATSIKTCVTVVVQPLGEPQNVVTGVDSSSVVNLGWSSVQGAKEYIIERQSNGIAFVHIAVTNYITYNDYTVTPSTYFTYKIKAKNAYTTSIGTSGNNVFVPTIVSGGGGGGGGPVCSIGCRCGNACISCSKTCHKSRLFLIQTQCPTIQDKFLDLDALFPEQEKLFNQMKLSNSKN